MIARFCMRNVLIICKISTEFFFGKSKEKKLFTIFFFKMFQIFFAFKNFRCQIFFPTKFLFRKYFFDFLFSALVVASEASRPPEALHSRRRRRPCELESKGGRLKGASGGLLPSLKSSPLPKSKS